MNAGGTDTPAIKRPSGTEKPGAFRNLGGAGTDPTGPARYKCDLPSSENMTIASRYRQLYFRQAPRTLLQVRFINRKLECFVNIHHCQDHVIGAYER